MNFFSASVTAVFELEDGTEKSFMRAVHGSSSEHRINGGVSIKIIVIISIKT